ncbi:hypothetical protein F5Y14DRAFT_394086 [Nemania sp. NC0429]|nr:hypothetical protein F5Y14DRAFT_394086 [Nemania sp. NC0429]
MGNTSSVESSGKVSRATQKLSKPRTGNIATAGLLNPSGVFDPARSPSSANGRRLSLLYNSTPASFLGPQETEHPAVDGTVTQYGTSTLVEDYPSNLVFRPDHEALDLEGHGVGPGASSSFDLHIGRTDSAYLGPEKGCEQAELVSAVSPRNYDLAPYEPQRLLNTVGEPSFEDRLTVAENELQVAPSRRQSYTTSYRPDHSDAAALLPRASSDASLYTPMRRRSLMTPGVATRPAPADLILPPDIQTGHDTPPTASHSYSPEPTRAGFLSIPYSPFDSGLIPRVHTPCETEYKQTGAFRYGTLRITNGSPARTPAWDTAENSVCANSSLDSIGRGSYFDDKTQAKAKPERNSDESQVPGSPTFVIASSGLSETAVATVADEEEATLDFLPELNLNLTPFSISEIEPESLELQTCSKDSAIENDLFENGLAKYNTEVLNVRIDHDAKSRSISAGASTSDRQKEIDRSDSGVVAGNAPHKSLCKADSGYSSSVSIRSGSSKRNGQQKFGRARNIEPASPQPHAFHQAKLPGNSLVTQTHSAIDAFEVQFQLPPLDRPPSLLPKKNHYQDIPKPVTGISGAPQMLAGIPGSVSDEVSAGEAPESASSSTLRPNRSSTSTSNLSTGNTRKAGTFQRVLIGAHTPLPVHGTHALDREVNVPPAPQATREKLHENAGASPSSSDSQCEHKHTTRENSNSTTLNQISITHDEAVAIQTTEDDGSRTRIATDKAHGLKSRPSRINSIGSRITRVASYILAKNRILRKPIFAKAESEEGHDTPATTAQRADESVQWHSKGIENAVTTSSGERGPFSEPAPKTVRSNSLSIFEGGLNVRIYDDVRRNSLMSQPEQHTLSFQKPYLSPQYSVTGTPPPVSMKARNLGQLQAPSPIRAYSTPPITPESPILLHNRSQSIQCYPPYAHSTNSNYVTLPRRPSQENFYNYSMAQTQSFSNQSSQLAGTADLFPSNFQHQAGYRTASGVPNFKHGTTSSWEQSSDHSRLNSLTSQTSQRSVPSSPQSWSYRPPYDTLAVRNRSSCDASSFQIPQSYGQDSGPHPALPPANGQMYISDSLRRQPTPQQLRQHQQQAQYPPRGHVRHHSLDQQRSPVQYRVLHSYNSPAYRGVPIWSN